MSDLPAAFFWAWERPDDLRTLPPDVGVAYLAATFRIVDDRVVTIPRMQPLMVPSNAVLISVFRIEVDENEPSRLNDNCVQKLTKKICNLANLPRIRAVQIDFDARADERAFYRQLLFELRSRLPAGLPLSITALVSWCMCDNWMEQLPIDESVPMFFSMGSESHNILGDIAVGRRFSGKLCEQSLGISLNEPAVNAIALPALRARNPKQSLRLYIFSSKTWSKHSVENAVQIVRRFSSP